MIHLHGMVSARMFTLLQSRPHALSVSSKACFKHCLVMSYPLQLCTSEKLCVSHGMTVLISNGGICEVIQCGIDYAIMRWTLCSPSCERYMTNCCMRKGAWTGVWYSSWCKTHYGCRFDRFEGSVNCVCDVCMVCAILGPIGAPEMNTSPEGRIPKLQDKLHGTFTSLYAVRECHQCLVSKISSHSLPSVLDLCITDLHDMGLIQHTNLST